MASSAKEQNGTFKGPKSKTKSWSIVASGGSRPTSHTRSVSTYQQPTGDVDSLTSSASDVPLVDHFSGKVARPFLKGTLPYTFVIDITSVLDRQQKEFMVALTVFCADGHDLLWVGNHHRRDNNLVFAEILVSTARYQSFQANPTLQLENFAEPFMAYPTLSPSANIVKLSLTRLPGEYGRKEGGAEHLNADVEYNLGQFGQLIDCGFVQGGSGCYGGDAYAVLAVGEHHAPLQHSLHWSYHPLDFSSPTADLLPNRDHVLALATWAAMPPYCRYCHSMDHHALINCEARKQKLSFDLCHELGHYQRSCPRRNGDPDKSGNRRKVSQEQQKRVLPNSSSELPATTPPSSAAAKALAAPQPILEIPDIALDIQAASATAPATTTIAQTAAAHTQTAANANPSSATTPQHNTRSRSAVKPQSVTTAAPVTPVCKHCYLPGHQRTAHKDCLKNPKYLQSLLHPDVAVSMDHTDSSASDLTHDDASDSASMQD
ncbi:hypothetical protein MAM1_0756c11200 [Mucor ambiguus]|uniref:CCHC-type domain-containing protein n=1 Tax=Mucor ambiguus TaxID=91626 RepID=A0A0C9MW52_9FUNG|nr:hypothetical protein MAM1_0756c11200 [Mucor ambiguus]